MEKTLSVTAIEAGVVIDHIPAGQAVRLIGLLGLTQTHHQITIGLNLQSKHHGLKDIIKIQGRKLTDNEQQEIAILAPNATINVIEAFKVVKKIKDAPPSAVMGLIQCPNKQCITHHNADQSHFTVHNQSGAVQLHCRYCEKQFLREELPIT